MSRFCNKVSFTEKRLLGHAPMQNTDILLNSIKKEMFTLFCSFLLRHIVFLTLIVLLHKLPSKAEAVLKVCAIRVAADFTASVGAAAKCVRQIAGRSRACKAKYTADAPASVVHGVVVGVPISITRATSVVGADAAAMIWICCTPT